MQLQLPSRLCATLADAVIGAKNTEAAYTSLSAVMLAHTAAETMVFIREGGGWTRVAGGSSGERERAWREGLASLPEGSPTVSLINDPAVTHATVITVADREGLAIVMEHDWTAAANVLAEAAAIVATSLEAVRQRDLNRRSDRLLRRIYRLTSRIAAASDDTLVQRIVDQVAAMFAADRVSIALYDASENCLRIKATRGTPMSVVHDIRIPPGQWIIGRVYDSGKALAVNDVRALPASHSNKNRYRSEAFVVVPLTHRGQVVGVLSITDKRDGLPFATADQFAINAAAAAIASAIASARNVAEMARLEHAASVDSLTGLLNRGYLDSRLQQEVARSQRDGSQFAFLMADIDDFKVINDSRGHQSGDAVLKAVGDIMRSAVRVFDVCARWGGDEFAVLMPNSDYASAIAVAERIRVRTAQFLAEREGAAGLTISIGVVVGAPGDAANDLISRADRALYDAKTSGKDAVRLSVGETESTAIDSTGSRRIVEASGESESSGLRPPYVLVADPNREREPVYRAAADHYRLGLLVAQNGEQAARVIEQFGPPVLLIADMTAAKMRGLALIDAAAGKGEPVRVVAFSATRAFREYADSKPEGIFIDVLRPNAPEAAVRAVLDRALKHRVTPPAPPSEAESELSARNRQATEDLTDRALEIVPAPGVAVYVKDPIDLRVRGTVTWVADAEVAHAHHHVPAVVDRVLATQESIMVGAVGTKDAAPADANREGYSLLGAPVRKGDEVIGAVCAFGDGPLSVEADTLDALADAAFSWGDQKHRPDPVETTQVSERRSERPERSGEQGASDDLGWQPTLLERKRGEFEVARELARVRREQRQLSVVLFDVRSGSRDAEPGHAIDDELLSGVADTFVRAIRQSDLPIQWSGHELLLVLPGLAGTEARTVAERVRAAMQAGGRHRVAVAGAVAQIDTDEQFASVVRRAGEKLAKVRGLGHNRVG